MQTLALDKTRTLNVGPAAPAQAAPADEPFADALARASSEARQAAEQFVATAFIMPMLEAMRDDTLGSRMFHGGMSEDAFASQLDTMLADQIVRRMSQPVADLDGRREGVATGFDLVESIHRRVMQRIESMHRAAEKLGQNNVSGVDLRG